MNASLNITQLSSSTTTAIMDDLRNSVAIIGIIIYVGGFIGNFLSLLLFIQKELRQISTGVLFLLLNIFSTIHLLSLIIEFLDTIFGIQVISSSIFQCQFILWLQNVTCTICSFLATTISIDRFIRSQYPVQSRIWCTPKNVLKLLIAYIIFSILFYAFYYYPLNLFDNQGYCSFSYNNTFRLFTNKIMPIIRFILICIIPTIIMLGCGSLMLNNIRQSRKRIAKQNTLQTTTTVAPIITVISKASSTMMNSQRQKIAVDRMLLLMVLANVFIYILTQTPFNIYAIYYGYNTLNNYLAFSLAPSFLLMWSSIYFGVGFYLFFMSSVQFRKQFRTKLKSICICYRPLQRQTLSIRNN